MSIPFPRRALAAAALALVLAACGEHAGASDPSATVEVEVTPQACLDALDAAETVIDDASQALQILGDAMVAAGNGDLGPLESAAGELDALKAHVTPAVSDYRDAATECRG